MSLYMLLVLLLFAWFFFNSTYLYNYVQTKVHIARIQEMYFLVMPDGISDVLDFSNLYMWINMIKKVISCLIPCDKLKTILWITTQFNNLNGNTVRICYKTYNPHVRFYYYVHGRVAIQIVSKSALVIDLF